MSHLSRCLPVVLVVAALAAAGCQSWSKPVPVLAPGEAGYQVRRLGEHFATEVGNCVVIRVDDEYRLIIESRREGVSGMFEAAYSIGRDDVDWAEWGDIESAPGLRIAFLSPEEIAVRFERPAQGGR